MTIVITILSKFRLLCVKLILLKSLILLIGTHDWEQRFLCNLGLLDDMQFEILLHFVFCSCIFVCYANKFAMFCVKKDDYDSSWLDYHYFSFNISYCNWM